MAEQIQGLSIGLGLDTAGIDEGLKSLRNKLKMVNSEMAANMSAFDRGERSVQKYQTQLGGLNRKLEVQKAAVNAARAQYDRMVAAHGEGSVQAQRAATAFNNEVAAVNNLERHVGSLTDEFREFERQQQISNSTFGRLGTSLDNLGSRFSSVGGGLKKAGSSMSMYITAPLAGIAVASAKTAIDFESQMSRVGAIAGATSDELKQLSDSALELGASTSKSASEVAIAQEGLAAMGFTTQEIIGAMPGVISAAESSGADMAQTADVMASALNVFGLEASDATRVADILAQTANQSAADITDMQYALKYAGGPAAALGVSLEELSGSIGIMTDAGLTGENAGTALRGALLGLLSPSEKNSKMMDTMGIAITDAEGNFVGLSKLVDNLGKSMEGQTETQKAATLASLVGKEAVSGMLALMSAGPAEIDKVTKSLENSGGASAEAAKKMKDNLGGALDELGGAFETAAITIGTILTPAIHKGTAMIQGLVEKFQNASPAAQKTAVVVAGLAAALGPFLVVAGQVGLALGGFMSVIGPIATAIAGAGGLAASFGVAGTAIAAFATGPVGLAIAAIAGIGIGVGLLVNHFRKDAIPEVDRFGDKVSEKTKEALGGFFKLSDGASQELMNLRVNGLVVTELMADELLSKYEDMNTQILEGMKARYTEENEQMKAFFANSATLSEQEENKIMMNKQLNQEKSLEAQQLYEDQIQMIVEKAATEKRELTETELAKIDMIHQKMNESAVVYLSENEMEQKVILERMAATSDELSAKQAAAVTKNSADSRDKVIADAESKYNETVAMAIRERDETGALTAEQAQKIIDEATKAKDGAVLKAEEMHAEVVEEAKKQAEGHIEQVDWETGEILSKWDVYKNGVVTKFQEMNKQSMEDFRKWGEDYNTWSTGVQSKSSAFWRSWADGVATKFRETNSTSLGDFKRWGQNYNEWAADVKARANENWRQYGEGVVSRFRRTNTDSLADFKRWGGNIKSFAGEMKEDALRQFAKIVAGAVAIPGKIKTGINNAKGLARDGMASLGNSMIGKFESVVNGLIGGVNTVSGKLGIDKKLKLWDAPEFAHGTDHHKGGPMIVGDKYGRELVELPNGKTFLSPDTDTLIPNAPKGTRVIPNKITEKVLKGEIPMYNSGAGVMDWLKEKGSAAKDWAGDKLSSAKDWLGDVWDYATNPSGLLKKIVDNLGLNITGLSGGAATLAKGAFGKTKESALSYIKGMFESDEAGMMAGSGHGFGSKFRLTSRRGFRFNPVTGQPQIHQGDDWAAPAGTLIPAQAAGKVIQSAFHAIRGNYVRIKTGNMDRLYQHNTRNLVRVGQNVRKGQAVGTVGSTGRSTGPHLHYEVRRNGVNINPNGLETGGLIQSEQLIRAGEKGRDEIMIPLHPSRRTDAMKLLALAGKRIMGGRSDKGITRPNQLPNVGNIGGSAMDAILAATIKTNEFLQEQNRLLLQLLQKDSNVYVDGDSLVVAIGSPMNTHLGNSSKSSAYMNGVR